MKILKGILVAIMAISMGACGGKTEKMEESAQAENKVKVVETSKALANGADDWGPQASPDGNTVAFYSKRMGSDAGRILTVDAKGGEVIALPYPQTNAHDIEPHWTSDGKQIIFTSQYNGDENGNVSSHINSMNVDGTGLKQLYDYDGEEGKGATHFGSWIEEGKSFVFFYWPYSAFKANIFTVNVDGSNLKQLTFDGSSFRPVYIDGKIWFNKNDGAYVMDTDGENVVNLSEKLGHTISTGFPSKNGLYFFRVNENAKSTTFYKASLDLTSVEELQTIHEEVKYFLSVSSSQNCILYNVMGKYNHDIHKVNLVSGIITTLVADN